MLVLLSLLDRLPRRDSRRAVESVMDGVRESPPTAGVLSLPTSRYSDVERFHPEQKGQNSHLISHPVRPSLDPQLARFVEGEQDLVRWYHRWRQGRTETFSSATHMVEVVVLVK